MSRWSTTLGSGAALACGLAAAGCQVPRGWVPDAPGRPAVPPVRAMAAPPTEPPAMVQAQATEAPDRITEAGPNIDLAHALELAGVGNPTVNLAREAAREAEARLLAADALKLPSLDAGLNFRVHRGNLQRAPGTLLDVNSQSFYFGGGAGAVGAGTAAVPGVRLFLPLAEVVSEPRAARQRLVARRADAAAVANVTLLDVAATYLELLRADAALAELRRGEAEFAEVARATAAFARAGQGRSADANRAAANLQLLRRQAEDAEGERAAVSARLAGLLSLDPTVRLTPPGGPLYALKMIDADAPLEGLIAQAEANRPELLARSADVAEARVRVRQEQVRPFLPTLAAGFSVGGFGGGSNLTAPEFGRFGTRTDFDVSAVWTVENLGFGNRARVRRNRAIVGEAAARLAAARNLAREEVATAQADALAAAARIETARGRLAAAEEGFREEAARIKQGEGLPLEALDSTRSLTEARLELARAVTDHNVAQFRLLTAVGIPAGAVSLPAR